MTKNASAPHTWLVLMKAHDAIEKFAEKSIVETGLNYTDFGALEMLLHKGSLPVNVMGRKLRLTTGSITTAVDRLESRGLVARGNDETDKRIRLVHLTDAGRALIESAFQRHIKDLERLFGVLQEEERETLISLVKKVGKNAESAE